MLSRLFSSLQHFKPVTTECYSFSTYSRYCQSQELKFLIIVSSIIYLFKENSLGIEMSFRGNLTTERTLMKGQEWTTTPPLTPEEEDAIVTLVVVVFGVIVAIVVLFSIGVFLDCKHQRRDRTKKNTRLRLKTPVSHMRNYNDDRKSLASDMCSNDSTQFGAIKMTADAAV